MRRALMTALTLAGVLVATLPLLAEEPETPVPPVPPVPAPAPVPQPTPDPQADAAAIQRLVDDLGSSDFVARERASKALLALGEQARPALEATMSKSDNMEARWRAEQILRRMDREGERRMGQGAEEPLQPGPAPGVLPPGGPPLPPSSLDEMQRRMDELRRRLFDGFGPDAFGDFGPSRKTLEAQGLRLDAEVFAGRLVQVTVLDRRDARVYHGRSLEDILERNPDLARHAGMAELEKQWAAYLQANPDILDGGLSRLQPGSGFSFTQNSKGVEITHGPDGVTVRIRETDDDGEEQVTEVHGASLDEIREQHPELREKLESFRGFSLQLGPVQIFRNRPGGRRLPVPPAPPRTEITPADDQRTPAIFGVHIMAPEPVLAVHLGLEPGHGALITQVVPDTQAAAMGLERYDVIVAVNGAPVTDYREATLGLRKAAGERSALRLDLIRRGSRITLER